MTTKNEGRKKSVEFAADVVVKSKKMTKTVAKATSGRATTPDATAKVDRGTVSELCRKEHFLDNAKLDVFLSGEP